MLLVVRLLWLILRPMLEQLVLQLQMLLLLLQPLAAAQCNRYLQGVLLLRTCHPPPLLQLPLLHCQCCVCSCSPARLHCQPQKQHLQMHRCSWL